jgi:hypothetical protein
MLRLLACVVQVFMSEEALLHAGRDLVHRHMACLQPDEGSSPDMSHRGCGIAESSRSGTLHTSQ